MECLTHTPLLFLSVELEETFKIINDVLPFSIGLEFECPNKDTYDLIKFQEIPHIMEVSNDSSEKRFRIPHGIKGAICLDNILEQMRVNCIDEVNSGIHYHVDMTDVFQYVNHKSINSNKHWILNEFDKWGTADVDRSRDCMLDCRCWVQFQSQFKTCEVRIGEMSFDYNTVITRVIDASRIVRMFKNRLVGSQSVNNTINENYETFDPIEVATYLDGNNDVATRMIELNKIKEEQSKILSDINDEENFSISPTGNLEKIIEDRVIKRY